MLLMLSYRQTIDNYPNGGGAYMVAKENLGHFCRCGRRRLAFHRLYTDGSRERVLRRPAANFGLYGT